MDQLDVHNREDVVGGVADGPGRPIPYFFY